MTTDTPAKPVGRPPANRIAIGVRMRPELRDRLDALVKRGAYRDRTAAIEDAIERLLGENNAN